MSGFLKETLMKDGEAVEILIEVDEPRSDQHRELSYGTLRGEDSTTVATRTFEKGMKLISTCAEQIAETVQRVSDAARPEEVEVKFGVKLSGEAGALIAKTGSEAHMEVTLKWTGKKSE